MKCLNPKKLQRLFMLLRVEQLLPATWRKFKDRMWDSKSQDDAKTRSFSAGSTDKEIFWKVKRDACCVEGVAWAVWPVSAC